MRSGYMISKGFKQNSVAYCRRGLGRSFHPSGWSDPEYTVTEHHGLQKTTQQILREIDR